MIKYVNYMVVIWIEKKLDRILIKHIQKCSYKDIIMFLI